MKQSEYLRYDAVALADLIRRGEVAASEICEAAIKRAATVNGKLNAICHPQFSDALSQTSTPDSTFSGVPMLLKDLAQEQQGQPCTYGSRGLKKNIASRDSEFVRRARAARGWRVRITPHDGAAATTPRPRRRRSSRAGDHGPRADSVSSRDGRGCPAGVAMARVVRRV